jgi:hypothetical protein
MEIPAKWKALRSSGVAKRQARISAGLFSFAHTVHVKWSLG